MSQSYPDSNDGVAGRTNSAEGQDIGDVSRGCLQDTQDLAVSNHGRTGRDHVLRTQRGIETSLTFQRCRFKSVGHPASRVQRSAEYALTSRPLHL